MTHFRPTPTCTPPRPGQAAVVAAGFVLAACGARPDCHEPDAHVPYPQEELGVLEQGPPPSELAAVDPVPAPTTDLEAQLDESCAAERSARTLAHPGAAEAELGGTHCARAQERTPATRLRGSATGSSSRPAPREGP